jgi:hypothetical protein
MEASPALQLALVEKRGMGRPVFPGFTHGRSRHRWTAPDHGEDRGGLRGGPVGGMEITQAPVCQPTISLMPTASPGPAVTLTISGPAVQPSTSPASSISASGSCSWRWITRFSGRAPKTGS